MLLARLTAWLKINENVEKQLNEQFNCLVLSNIEISPKGSQNFVCSYRQLCLSVKKEIIKSFSSLFIEIVSSH